MVTSDSSLFRQPKLKILRAEMFYKEIYGIVDAFKKAEPIEISNESVYIDDSSNNRKLHFSATTRVKELPEIIPAVLGDFFHNLRSALDILACDLVEANGYSRNGVYFPFAKSKAELQEQIKSKKFDRAGADAVALLESFEPYVGGQYGLREIHDLDIGDKHKLMISLPQVPIKLFLFKMFDDDGKPIMPIPLIHPEAKSHVELVFGPGSKLEGKNILNKARELITLLNRIVSEFESIKNR